jgi:hypothetical protein
MNIENLEAILQEMREAAFGDVQDAVRRVRQWVDDIDAAVSDHLMSELGVTFGDEPINNVHTSGTFEDEEGASLSL